jgi:hypothetical protein
VSATIAHGIPNRPTGMRKHAIFEVNHETPIIGNIRRTHNNDIGNRRIPKEMDTRIPNTNVVMNCNGTTIMAAMPSMIFSIRFASIKTIPILYPTRMAAYCNDVIYS